MLKFHLLWQRCGVLWFVFPSLSHFFLFPLHILFAKERRFTVRHEFICRKWSCALLKIHCQTKVRTPVNVKNRGGMRGICAQTRGGTLQPDIPHWAVKYLCRVSRDRRSKSLLVSLFLLEHSDSTTQAKKEVVSSLLGRTAKIKRKGIMWRHWSLWVKIKSKIEVVIRNWDIDVDAFPPLATQARTEVTPL